MTQRAVVLLTDDIDGTESEDNENLRFSVNGKELEIDLKPENLAKFYDAIKLFMEHARELRDVAPVMRRIQTKANTPTRPAMIREWCKEKGIIVNDMGRVPREVEKAYDIEHPDEQPQRSGLQYTTTSPVLSPFSSMAKR